MRWVCLWKKKVAVLPYSGTDTKTVDKLAELPGTFQARTYLDTSSVFNTDLLYTIELGSWSPNGQRNVWHSALARRSRGAHQRASG